eukprot:5421837-Pleurochrysis_carterae.AAC.1
MFRQVLSSFVAACAGRDAPGRGPPRVAQAASDDAALARGQVDRRGAVGRGARSLAQVRIKIRKGRRSTTRRHAPRNDNFQPALSLLCLVRPRLACLASSTSS